MPHPLKITHRMIKNSLFSGDHAIYRMIAGRIKTAIFCICEGLIAGDQWTYNYFFSAGQLLTICIVCSQRFITT